MGKKSPTPPAAPDYATLAVKQGEANLAAAKQSAYMSNPNVYSPYGQQTVTWTKTPTVDTEAYNKALEDWRNNAYQNAEYNIPAPTQDQYTSYIEQPTVRQTVSDTAQQAIRAQEQAELSMSQAAAGAASGLGNLGIASAFRPSGIPDLTYGATGVGNVAQPTDITQMGTAQSVNAIQGAAIPSSSALAAQAASSNVNPYSAIMAPGSQYYGVAGAGPAAGQLSQFQYGGPGVQMGVSGGMYGLAGTGPQGLNLQNVDLSQLIGSGVQNQVSANQYGLAGVGPQGLNLQGLDLSGIGGPAQALQQGQFGYAAQGTPTAQLQGQIDVSGLPQAPTNAGMTAQQAILSRLSPQLTGERQQLQTQLINQGLRPGGEAYNNAMMAQAQKENDLMLQAAAQGISLDQAARQQAFNEQQSRAMFANQAALSGFGMGMEQAGLYNAGLGQNVQNALAIQSAQNQAQQQAFQQRLQSGEFGQQAQLASFGTQQQAQQAANQAVGQNFQQALAAQEAQNQAQQQAYQQALGAAGFNREGQLASFGTQQQAQELNNQAIAQSFQQALAAQGAQNQAQQQAYQQALGAAGFNREALLAQFGMGQQAQELANQAIAQNYNQSLQQTEAQNAALQQNFNQQLAAQQAANAARAQNYSQLIGGSAAENIARQQIFDQTMAQQQLSNQALGQRQQTAMDYFAAQNAAQQQAYQQAMAQAQFRNTAAQQALAQQAAIRSIPVNEISALLSGGQVNVPQFQGYSGVTVAPAPIFQGGQAAGNFAQQNYANQVGSYNAGMGLLGSLAGAAGTALGGPLGGALGKGLFGG